MNDVRKGIVKKKFSLSFFRNKKIFFLLFCSTFHIFVNFVSNYTFYPITVNNLRINIYNFKNSSYIGNISTILIIRIRSSQRARASFKGEGENIHSDIIDTQGEGWYPRSSLFSIHSSGERKCMHSHKPRQANLGVFGGKTGGWESPRFFCKAYVPGIPVCIVKWGTLFG